MKAAILNPGPSLVETFADREGYDIRIGVNRAVGAFRCDYWAILDSAEAFEQAKPIGTPAILSIDASWLRLLKMTEPGPRAAKHRFIDFNDVSAIVPIAQVCQKIYSIYAAIALAYKLGANQIDVYGADWEGEADFDGRTWCNNNRGEDRWKSERNGFESLRTWMLERGVLVTRIPARTLEVGAATNSRTLEVAAL